MSDDKMRVALQIIGESASVKAALNQARGSVRSFVNQTRAEFSSLRSFWGSTFGKLAGLGLGFGAFQMIRSSAELHKKLLMVGIAAGKTGDDVKNLKNDIETMTIATGQSAGAVAEGFSVLYKGTGSWDAAAASLGALNTAMAGSGAGAETLVPALVAAQKAFAVDPSKTGAAMEFFNLLSAAGKGAGGMEQAAGTFSHMAARAQLAGLSLQGTMQLIKAMGTVQGDPEQAGIMAESALKMFTNLKILGNKKSGIFRNLLFDRDGARRDAINIMQEIQKQYTEMGDESKGGSRRKQDAFLYRLTGGLDARSLMSMQLLMKAPLGQALEQGANTLENKARNATESMIVQINRLKNSLEHAADPFLEKLQGGIASTIGFLMDKDKLNMSGGHIAATGIGLSLAVWGGGAILKNRLGRWLRGGGASTAAGIAEGKALQAAAGVTPVFVTNWPAAGIDAGLPVPGAPGIPVPAKAGGALGLLGKAGLVGGTALLAFEGTRAVLEATGLNAALEKLGGKIYEALHPGSAGQPGTNININLTADGKVRAISDNMNSRVTVKKTTRGSFFEENEFLKPATN